VELEEEFYPLNSDLMGGGRHMGDDGLLDPSLVIDERNALDLSEVVGQALAGSMPIAPLCSAACAGICPTCSVNRNLKPCYCDQTPTDPRWAELARLVSGAANSQG
jgi:uncharacterized protein